MLDAAESGDEDAYLKAIDAHYEPLLTILETETTAEAKGDNEAD